MNPVTVALAIAFGFLLTMWAWGAWLLRRDARIKAAAEAADIARDDREYQRSRDDMAIEDMVATVRAEAVAYGAYYAAVELGVDPIMPARTMAEAWQRRQSRNADQPSESVVDVDDSVTSNSATRAAEIEDEADSWWMQSAGRQNPPMSDATVASDSPAIPVQQGWGLGADPRWDAVRCADGRVKASLVLGRR